MKSEVLDFNGCLELPNDMMEKKERKKDNKK